MKSIPPVNRKAYDGSVVVTHQIAQGESIQAIAAIYGFSQWKPIWVYNTKVENTIGDNPDLIRHGVTIFIPRSASGYDSVIRKLKRVGLDMEATADSLIYGLEADKYKLEATKILVNFSADVLTLVAGLALKAGQAAKAAAVAQRTKEQAKIAARLASRADVKAMADSYAAVRGRLVKQALNSHAASSAASAGVKQFIAGKAIDAGVKAGDEMISQISGEETNPLKHAKNATKLTKIAMSAGSMAVKGLEVVDVLLDYIEPSNVAEAYMYITTGETSQMSFGKAKASIQGTTAATLTRIENRIEELKAERKLLYGN